MASNAAKIIMEVIDLFLASARVPGIQTMAAELQASLKWNDLSPIPCQILEPTSESKKIQLPEDPQIKQSITSQHKS